MQRADRALTAVETERHLRNAVNLLVPALLAKFALRYTLTSPEQRRAWNDQQARGLDVAFDAAIRLDDAKLVADLVILTRVQGTLVPVTGTPIDEVPALGNRAGHFGDAPPGSVPVAVAEVLGIDVPAILAPPPQLVAPDGLTVLENHYRAALERYGSAKFGLSAERLRQPGRMRL